MTTSQVESKLMLTTESPDQPTHPESLGSSMTLNLGDEETGMTQATFSEADKAPDPKVAQQEAALRRASGPYLTPEAVGIEWFAQPHPAPWMRWVIMTPEIARYLLREHNTDNRPLRPGRTDYYEKIIVNGRWRLTHQGVAMDSRGVLQDGQHRLQAIVDAADELDDDSIKVPMPFFVGMPPENFSAIDEGLNRSAMDLFTKGGVKYGSILTTMVRLAIAFNDQAPRRRIRENQPNDVILQFYADNNSELMGECAKFGSVHWKKAFSTAGPLSAAAYVLREANGADNAYVTAFLEGLTTGRKAGTRLSLDDDDPRATCRTYFQNVKLNTKRLRGIEALSIMIIAWNNCVLGKRPRYVHFTDNTPIPRVMLCADKGPNASACPEAFIGEIQEGE